MKAYNNMLQAIESKLKPLLDEEAKGAEYGKRLDVEVLHNAIQDFRKVEKEAEDTAKKIRIELKHRITALQGMAKRLEETQQRLAKLGAGQQGILGEERQYFINQEWHYCIDKDWYYFRYQAWRQAITSMKWQHRVDCFFLRKEGGGEEGSVTGVLREGLIVITANNLSFGRLGEKEGDSFPWSLAPYLSLTVRA